MFPIAIYTISLKFLSWSTIVSSTSSTDVSILQLKNIPGDSLDWTEQREQNCLYADKTIYLEYMLTDEMFRKFFFIHRPRRFGKSSFIRMTECFFSGYDSLFRGLHIYDQGNIKFFKNFSRYSFSADKLSENQTWIQCPVISLNFLLINYFNTMDELKIAYEEQLRDIAEHYILEYAKHSHPDISSLIFKLRSKFQWNVVLLIDEYDAPFMHALHKLKNPKLAEEVRGFIDTLLGNIKGQGKFLRLVLVLGISRLTMVNLESGPNVYADLTYDERFSGAFGFTENDIRSFQREIAHRFNLDNEKKLLGFIGELRNTYDGYNFAFRNSSLAVNVLNPVSTMKSLHEKKFECYWVSTGSMNEVVRRLYFAQIPLQKFEKFNVSRKDLLRRRNPAEEAIPVQILMFTYGYLTITSYYKKTEIVTLGFPNKEIKSAVENEVNAYHPKKEDYEVGASTCLLELDYHMRMGNIEGAMDTLKSMFMIYSPTLEQGVNEFDVTKRLVDNIRRAGIPCDESKKFRKSKLSSDEGGDIDVVTLFPEPIFAMEVKFQQTAILAIQKLIDYLDQCRETFLDAIRNPGEAYFVGVNFIAEYGGKLNEWIAIPWKNGTLMYDQMVASPHTLIQELHDKINTTKYE